jgi:hypothetical protein
MSKGQPRGGWQTKKISKQVKLKDNSTINQDIDQQNLLSSAIEKAARCSSHFVLS